MDDKKLFSEQPDSKADFPLEASGEPPLTQDAPFFSQSTPPQAPSDCETPTEHANAASLTDDITSDFSPEIPLIHEENPIAASETNSVAAGSDTVFTSEDLLNLDFLGEEAATEYADLDVSIDDLLISQAEIQTPNEFSQENEELNLAIAELVDHGNTDPSIDISALLSTEPQESAPPQINQENMKTYADTHTNSQTPQQTAPVSQAKPRVVRKGRPNRKRGDGLFGIPHLISTGIWLVLILVIGVTLGRMAWLCAADVLAFGRQDHPVTITIDSTDDIDSIADKLHTAGLIRYPGLFRLYAELTIDEGEISPGTFSLNTLYDYHALVNAMSSTSSYRAVVTDVLIPEGYSCRQIFELLERKGICSVSELEAYAATGEFADYWFLEDLERGDKYCLEGYLFPDTYDFYENSTPREALGKMLTGFNNRINEEIYGQLDSLNATLANMMRADGRSEEYINSHRFTFHDAVIVASLIEKEAANSIESYNVASVIYNRLFAWGSTPAYLNIDASIIYAMGGGASHIDTGFDSPYNTYLNTGLTPGPIANPGISSLKAALSPANTEYYYYVLNPETGLHTFSKTYEEHQELIDKYRQ